MSNPDNKSMRRTLWPKVRPYAAFLFWTLTIVYFAFFSLCAATRWYLLPQVGQYKEEIAELISKATGTEASIGEIRPEWTQFWPQITLKDVRLSSASQQQGERHSLVLNRVSAVFHWRSLLGRLSFRRLEIGDSHLSIKKLPDGAYEVGGIAFAPSAGASHDTDDMIIGWLMDQRRLYITNSSVEYADLSGPRPQRLELSSLQATFRKSLGGWAFGLQAVQHAPGAPKLDIRAHFSPSLFKPSTDWTAWKGEVYALFEDINTDEILAETPFRKILRSGYGDIELVGKFKSGSITAVDARLCLKDLKLQLKQGQPPLELSELSTSLKAEYDGEDAKLAVQNLVFKPKNGLFSGPIHVDARSRLKPGSFEPIDAAVSVKNVDLAKLARLAPALPIDKAVIQSLRKYAPRGMIKTAFVKWSGPLEAPVKWSVTTNFVNLGINAQPSGTKTDGIEDPGIPGFDRLSGNATVTESSGQITLASSKPTLVFPGVFEHPSFQLNALSGAVSWNSSGRQPLKVSFRDVLVDSPSARLIANGSWTDTGGAGTVDITGKAGRGRAQDVWLFMPLVIPKDVRDWLQAGLVRGRGDNCDVILRGDLNDFPWEDAQTKGKGTFFIKTDVTGAAIDYVPNYKRDARGNFQRASSWPLLTDINGTLTFNGMEMTVDATSAKTLGAHVSKAWAQIPSLIDSDAKLLVDGTVESTPLANGVAYLAKSPVGAILDNAFAKTKAAGQVGLNLKLDIPLLHAEDTKVNGLIHFRNNQVDMGWPVPPVQALSGDLTFTHIGAVSDKLTGQAFSSPVAARVETVSPGLVRVKLKGKAEPANIPFFQRGPIIRTALGPLTGKTDFDAELMIGSTLTVRVNSNLVGVSSPYPAPLGKQPEEPWPTEFQFTTQQNGSAMQLRAGNKFQMLLDMPAGTNAPISGTIAVGKQARMPRHGLCVEVNAREVVADQWEEPAKKLLAAIQAETAQLPADTQIALGRVNVDIDKLTTDDLVITDLKASGVNNGQSKWHIVVTSNQIVGSANWDLAGRGLGTVSARFDKLHIPAKSRDRIQDLLASSSLAELPSISASVKQFQYGSMTIGQVTLDAVNTRDTTGPVWRISNLSVVNAGGTMKASGDWKSHRGTNITTLQAKADISDSGKMLSSLNLNNVISGAHGTASVDISWRGVPWQPMMESLAGSGILRLEKGNLRQVDTGAGGALLSLVSMQSLLKRLTLDFSDLGKGLAFDQFGGTFLVEDGLLHSEDFKFTSSKAAVLISGSANLPEESLDAHVLVLPDVNALGASLALTAVNPVIGIGSFLAQLVVRNPLSNMFSSQYAVTGTFSDPIITKIQKRSEKPSLIRKFVPELLP